MKIGTQRSLKSLGMTKIVKKQLAGRDSDDEGNIGDQGNTGDQGPPQAEKVQGTSLQLLLRMKFCLLVAQLTGL